MNRPSVAAVAKGLTSYGSCDPTRRRPEGAAGVPVGHPLSDIYITDKSHLVRFEPVCVPHLP